MLEKHIYINIQTKPKNYVKQERGNFIFFPHLFDTVSRMPYPKINDST